jgi:hypothetical protein
MRALLVAAIVATGCGTACPDGICPDPDNTVAHAGPCRSAAHAETIDEDCVFEYDAAAHPTRIECTAMDGAMRAADYAWTGDALARIDTEDPGGRATWLFERAMITVTGPGLARQVYDPALFALREQAPDERVHPIADMGLILETDTTFTWDVGAMDRVRRGAGEDYFYTLDEHGRVLTITRVQPPTTSRVHTFIYAEHITRHTDYTRPGPDEHRSEYQYDRGGNPIVTEYSYVRDDVAAPIGRTTYDYSCW